LGFCCSVVKGTLELTATVVNTSDAFSKYTPSQMFMLAVAVTLGFVNVIVLVTVSVLLMLTLGSGVSDLEFVRLRVSEGTSVKLSLLDDEIVRDVDLDASGEAVTVGDPLKLEDDDAV
jgi:hypothetical protein